ncbi:RDD family protein [Streptomyces sp. NPDC057686]|uniref:RDD family protein n=1 Tax=Streptomyces sp. NPDC057686 TaxID=3346212 RepID=UPI0036C12A00
MSTDQPPPGQPPEDDPFLKKPQEPTPPSGGSPYGPPPGGPTPPPGGPYGGGAGGAGGGGGYPPPPPPPPPYGGGGDAFGGGDGMPDPLAGMPPLADTGRRLVARLIDLIIVSVPLAVIRWALGWNFYQVDTDKGEDVSNVVNGWYVGSGLVFLLISIVAYVGYDWWFTKSGGQTPGKKWLGMRVAMLNDGSVPTSKASLARAAALWLPWLVCCLCGCLWPIVLFISVLVDKPYQQGLHDKAGKTVVVRTT